MSDVLIKLTGLWQKTRRGNVDPGHFYLVGKLGAAKLLAFKNNRKEKPDDPDWNLFLTEPSQRRDQPTRRQATWNATETPPPPRIANGDESGL